MTIINRDTYSEFIKDEDELSRVLRFKEDAEKVILVIYALENYLEKYKLTGDIKNFSIMGNRIEIDTSRYIIHMLVLHSGDACQYTINKKTNHKGNYSRRFHFEAVLNTMNEVIGINK